MMNWSRIFSALIATIYLIVGFAHRGLEGAFKIGLFLIFPLFCIWFAEAMGVYIGPTLNGGIDTASPGWLVRICGWLLLLLPIIVVCVAIICS
jgi:hypothetical protein